MKWLDLLLIKDRLENVTLNLWKTLPRIVHTHNPLIFPIGELAFSLSLILLSLEHGRADNASVPLTCWLLKKNIQSKAKHAQLFLLEYDLEEQTGAKGERRWLILLQSCSEIIQEFLTEIFVLSRFQPYPRPLYSIFPQIWQYLKNIFILPRVDWITCNKINLSISFVCLSMFCFCLSF